MNNSSASNSPFPLYRDFSQTITSVFEFVHDHHRELLKLLCLIVVPVAIVQGFIENIMSDELQFTSIRELSEVDNQSVLLVINLFLSFFTSVLTATVTTVYCAYIHRNGRFPESLTILVKEVLSRLPSYIGVTLISTVILLFSAVICLVPALYFIVPLSLAYSVYEFENLGVVRSVDKAISYVKGNWWSTFGILFIILIVVSIVPLIFAMPEIVTLIIDLLRPDAEAPAAQSDFLDPIFFVSKVLSVVMQNVMESLLYIAAVFRYFSLKAIKEGTFLNTEIDLLGSDNSELREETY